ncbi:cation:proton antiporter [Catellatospora coxensis]
MRRIGQLSLFILLGLGIAWALSADVDALAHSTSYRVGAYLLLAVGLYSATYGIDLAQARTDKKIIVGAVTVGVVVKALLIGGLLALAWQNPLFLLLGVAVAQIDPLSVAALMGDERMSTRARTVLAAWSSFDDPFTVVLAVYASAVAATSFGLGGSSASDSDPLLLYAADLAGNLAVAAVAWALWRVAGSRPGPSISLWRLSSPSPSPQAGCSRSRSSACSPDPPHWAPGSRRSPPRRRMPQPPHWACCSSTASPSPKASASAWPRSRRRPSPPGC